ncbi:hypothetical protein MSEO_00110 [Mycobacterium seoulense]|uniref:Uncharacterized protein n=1 Tax=Mycobacterium seoulense TaxID=386911 RepID=A0A7I7NUI5_9MYCO|nr:hypothetical protein MSEO_00110 [Mycobacterium seoulense]
MNGNEAIVQPDSAGVKKSAGKARAGTILAAGALAFAGLMTTGVVVSHADTIQTEGNTQPGRRARTPGRA